jgi:hypothetical protein
VTSWHCYKLEKSISLSRDSGRCFQKNLEKNAANPWSLLGLAQNLKAMEKMEQLPDMEKRFRRAWSRSDFKLQKPIL